MISINISHAFPISSAEAFDYVTDLKNWPEYWPDFIRLEEINDIEWGREGARVRNVINCLAERLQWILSYTSL